METFCSEALTLKETFQATFLSDFQKKWRAPIEFTYTSFLNVPSGADEDFLIQCFQQFATVPGYPRYSTKNHGDIEYFTGTRITKHILCLNFLFSRQIKSIYIGQPGQANFPNKSNTHNDNTEFHSDTDSFEMNLIQKQQTTEKTTTMKPE